MPSGSHGGSGGSHSSGGSRIGGSFRGSSSSNSGNTIFMYHGHPRRFRWGHRYYVFGDRAQTTLSLLFFFIIFAFMVIFTSSIVLISEKSNLKTIQEDYYYYQDMIEYAEDHEGEGYILDAVVTDKFYNEDAKKYYITYRITSNDIFLDGYTYSCYTLAETSQFRVGTTIKVAVNSVPITTSTDSINMDYKNMPMDKDGEYLNAINTIRVSRIVLITSTIVLITIIGLGVFYAYKKKELVESQNNKNISTQEKDKTNEDSARRCKYCGALCDEGEKKCHCCGARL